MQIIIHRGTHQIGGCSTEIKTEKTRIFIDFGAELDSENAKPFDIDGVTKGKSNCDGIFFTHYHGDHIGLIDTVNNDIPLYMGRSAKEILTILNDRLSKSTRVPSHNKDKISNIKTFDAARKIVVGDIAITPFVVDHSAYDAYMFLIEADGKLHTGDFRGHGFRGKGLLPTLEKYIGKVDILICEGTTLNRTDKKCMTENELKFKIKDVIDNNKYVFVVCSSTNIDRIASACSVVPMGKYCLCDEYQQSIIDYISKTAGKKSSLYKIEKCNYYGENLDENITKRGFCMFVRSGNPYHKAVMENLRIKIPSLFTQCGKAI